MMPSLVLLAWLTAAVAADAGPRVVSIEASQPRAFGYFLGDVIRRDVALTLKPGARLENASLPRPGSVTYWLELRSVDTDEHDAGSGRTEVRVTLEYQAFYAALDPRRLAIPAFVLKVTDADGSEDVEIPEWSFVMSPLRELFPGKETEGPAVALQPDAAPHLLSTAAERTVLLAAAAAVLTALVLLAMHYAWGPFRHRPGRPFTEAARFLNANAARLGGEGGYRSALLKLHRAFDAAAGRRVLPDDLAAFLGEHPEFAPLSTDIERLFACSRTAFYGNDVARAKEAMPFAAIAELGSRLGSVERRAA
jgi:mxaA protein